MIKTTIDYLNEKITDTGFFNSVNCIAEKIEREGKEFPALCLGGEYKQIDLDVNGSLSYWRKNGNVTISEQDNSTLGCAVEYKTTVPLKLIGFIKKDSPYNDCYFSDNICFELMNTLTVNNAALKHLLKAKIARITAASYNTDRKTVSNEEYSDNLFMARYSHAYFSIDFNLEIISNQNCFNNICNG